VLVSPAISTLPAGCRFQQQLSGLQGSAELVPRDHRA